MLSPLANCLRFLKTPKLNILERRDYKKNRENQNQNHVFLFAVNLLSMISKLTGLNVERTTKDEQVSQ